MCFAKSVVTRFGSHNEISVRQTLENKFN
uniref:Uncharacterized protein n=1 Tax=Anguilla anguilla TaxID=7936 RepID=A0A0E9QNV4_ANGAN